MTTCLQPVQATATLHAEVIQGVPQHLAELMACFQADDDKLYPLVQVVRSFPVDKLAKKACAHDVSSLYFFAHVLFHTGSQGNPEIVPRNLLQTRKRKSVAADSPNANAPHQRSRGRQRHEGRS